MFCHCKFSFPIVLGNFLNNGWRISFSQAKHKLVNWPDTILASGNETWISLLLKSSNCNDYDIIIYFKLKKIPRN